MRRTLLLALVLPLIAGSSCGGADRPALQDKVAAAERLCPIMWQWVKDVGGAFNRASADVGGLSSPQERRDRWGSAFDEMEALNLSLLAAVTPLAADETLTPLLADVNSGVVVSLAEIAAMRALLRETPDIDEGRHQDRTQQLIVRVEKVIDVVKPELADYGDPELITAFRGVPSCQHSIKDADDGTPRPNG